MLEWDDLRTFLAVARHGSLSAAARALKVTQTTMGRRLEGLHERSGARLLQRTPQGFILTPAGEEVMGAVERMEEEALRVERRITGQDNRLEGLVRVTAVEALGSRVLTPILAQLHVRHPEILVELSAQSRAVSLARRETDIAVRIGAFTEPDVVARRAGEIELRAYAATSYLEARGLPDFASGAPGHARLVFAPPEDARPDVARPSLDWLAGLMHAAAVGFTSNSHEALLQAALGGMGVAALPRGMGDGAMMQGAAQAGPALVRLETPSAAPRLGIWIGLHEDTRHTPRIRVVADALHEGLQTAGAQLAGA
jgi:DNA-binding transcriptional LysR family regulator